MTAFQRFRTNLAACVGLAILAAMVLLAATAPLIFPTSPWEMVGEPYLRPWRARTCWAPTCWGATSRPASRTARASR